ncbi:hypothetical protein BHM03_00021615 [Ensete ventricosum]|nr:hypothetical protein BHM03_00021615 [Ensete ventricosum]
MEDSQHAQPFGGNGRDSTCGGIEAQDPDNGAPILAKCDPRVGSSTIQRTRPTSIRKEVDSEEHHNAVEVDLPIAKEGMQIPVGLSYPKAKRRLERMWTQRSTTVSQRWIYQSRRKGCRCKITDSRAMGLAAPWYRRGETSVESSIPCSHGGRALVIKGAKEV